MHRTSEPRSSYDYVVIGAGAAGMGFADSIAHNSERTVLLVDRRHSSGLHWNDAYPFVRLPSVRSSPDLPANGVARISCRWS